MTKTENVFSLYPIGNVKREKDGFYLKIEKKFIPALKQLEEFSHVLVFWWADKSDTEESRMKLQFKEIEVVGDGNRLYYSLGKALKKTQQELRQIISDYLLKNRKMKINGMLLEDWVSLEKDCGLDVYVRQMRMSGVWGGNMEIMVSSKIFRRNIFVLQKGQGKYKIVSSYVWANDARNMFLIYDGVHYNYLEVVKNLAGIKT